MPAKPLTILCLALLSADALAATYTFQQGVGGYTGARDTELRAADPDLNGNGRPVALPQRNPQEPKGRKSR